MSRPLALGLVLLVLILTSQSDWKDIKTEFEERTSALTKQEMASTNLEAVRREVILMQEKEIYDLKLQVRILQAELKTCEFQFLNHSSSSLTSVEQESDTRLTHRDESEESASDKSTELRVETAGNNELPKPPSELLAVDSFELADDDEEKLGDR